MIVYGSRHSCRQPSASSDTIERVRQRVPARDPAPRCMRGVWIARCHSVGRSSHEGGPQPQAEVHPLLKRRLTGLIPEEGTCPRSPPPASSTSWTTSAHRWTSASPSPSQVSSTTSSSCCLGPGTEQSADSPGASSGTRPARLAPRSSPNQFVGLVQQNLRPRVDSCLPGVSHLRTKVVRY